MKYVMIAAMSLVCSFAAAEVDSQTLREESARGCLPYEPGEKDGQIAPRELWITVKVWDHEPGRYGSRDKGSSSLEISHTALSACALCYKAPDEQTKVECVRLIKEARQKQSNPDPAVVLAAEKKRAAEEKTKEAQEAFVARLQSFLDKTLKADLDQDVSLTNGYNETSELIIGGGMWLRIVSPNCSTKFSDKIDRLWVKKNEKQLRKQNIIGTLCIRNDGMVFTLDLRE